MKGTGHRGQYTDQGQPVLCGFFLSIISDYEIWKSLGRRWKLRSELRTQLRTTAWYSPHWRTNSWWASAFGIRAVKSSRLEVEKHHSWIHFEGQWKKDLGPKSDCSWSKIKSVLSLNIQEERQIMVVRVGRAIAFLFTSWLGADLSKISLDKIYLPSLRENKKK